MLKLLHNTTIQAPNSTTSALRYQSLRDRGAVGFEARGLCPVVHRRIPYLRLRSERKREKGFLSEKVKR